MAKNKKEKRGVVVFIAIATVISLAGFTGLFGLGAPTTSTSTTQGTNDEANVDIGKLVAQTGIPCSENNSFTVRSVLTVTVDGVERPLPPIGTYANCKQEINMNGSDGAIYVESDSDKGYTFQDFLNVTGLDLEQIQQQGYVGRITVNGEFNNNDTSFKLEDGQQIGLEFISIPSFGNDSSTSAGSVENASQ